MRGLAARIQALEEALARRLNAKTRSAVIVVHNGGTGPLCPGLVHDPPREDELARAQRDRVPVVHVRFWNKDERPDSAGH